MSFTPDTKPPTEPRLFQEQTFNTAQEAGPVPWLMGEQLVAVKWISPAYNLRRIKHVGYKKDDSKYGWDAKTIPNRDLFRKLGLNDAPATYDWIAHAIGIACQGPADELVAVIADGSEIWPGGLRWRRGGVYGVNYLRRYHGFCWRATQAHVASDDNAPPNSDYWAPYSKVRQDGDETVPLVIAGFGGVVLGWGTDTQPVPEFINNNNFGQIHPAYPGLVRVELRYFNLGPKQTLPNLQLVLRRKPRQSIILGDAAELDDENQANPLAVTAELLTSDNGLNQAATIADDTTAQSTANDLLDEHELTYISKLIATQTTFRAVYQELAELTDCWARWNAATKKIEFGLYSHGSEPAVYTTLTKDDFAEGSPPQFDAGGWRDTINRAVIKFMVRTRAFKETSEKVDDMRAFTILGEYRSMTLERPIITRRDQAVRHAAETLRTVGGPQLSGTILVRRAKGLNIRPGSYVRLDIDWEPGGATLLQFFRVVSRDIPRRGPITLKVEAEETFLPLPVAAPVTPPEENESSAAAIEHARIIPAPPALATDPDMLVALVQSPDHVTTAVNAWFDTDVAGDFTQLATLAAFAQRATLREDVAEGDLQLRLLIPAQPDTDLFSQQPGNIAANDDTLLAIVLTVGPTIPIADDDGNRLKDDDGNLIFGDDDDGVLEDGDGYYKLEVCSVSAAAVAINDDDGGVVLDDDGNVVTPDDPVDLTDADGAADLTVLRGRLGTEARAFAKGNTEVWLIRKRELTLLLHNDFAGLRANRAEQIVPDLGYFRLQSVGANGVRPLADCSNILFRFPRRIQSGPRLTLTSPASASVDVAEPYPQNVQVTGTIVDSGSLLTSYKVSLRLSSEAAETTIEENAFTPADEKTFDVPVSISSPGTWYIYVRAWDNAGLRTEVVFTVTAAASASTQVAAPEFYYNGHRIADGSDLADGSLMQLRCATPGATIEYRFFNNPATPTTPWRTYGENPTNWPHSPRQADYVAARATKAGMTDSVTVKVFREGS